MEIIDYNGQGRWSLQAIRDRYSTFAQAFGVANPRDLIARHHQSGDTLWIYPIMDAVIEGIETGDAACAQLGVEFIEEDQTFPFGRILKSNVARALRRTPLSDEQKERIRKRVIDIWLHHPRYPREFRQYRNLLRKIGLGSWWPYVEQHIDRSNEHQVALYEYFLRLAPPDDVQSRRPPNSR
jgi:hypothetical protein